MTTAEMVSELMASLGNRTDIVDARYALWLNWALYDLCGFHRKKMLPSLRFRVLEGKFTASVPVVTDTATAGAASTITLAVVSSAVDDFYKDRVLELTDYDGDPDDGLLNQVRIITGYVGATRVATLDEAWTVNPDSSTDYSIYQHEIDILTVTGLDPDITFWSLEKLETIRGTEIDKKDWQEMVGIDFTNALADIPSEYARHGDSILFNMAINETLAVRGWYYKHPTALVATSPAVICELPLNWHEVIVLGAVYRGFEKLMEPERAIEARAQYVEEAANRLTEQELDDGSISRGLKARSYIVEL